MHNDITKAAWRKASYCNGATACVEVAPLADGNVALRDSKQEDGPVLVFTPAEWTAFVAACHGQRVRPGHTGRARMTNGSGMLLAQPSRAVL